MPKITLPDGTSFEAPENKRLVLALEDAGIDILHRCGGNARCTTCRVVFRAGEPSVMTRAERDRLTAGLLVGKVRLSCQILCRQDMSVEPVYRVSNGDADSSGDRPADDITPPAEWVSR
ncbi:MAG: (2Fe-2S)-binding protein [Chloroflexi bacterium]|nr:(2Fe-2S)-binding protein [Chloroflexota bacterium]